MLVQQSEHQYYTINLTLTNKFLKWVYTHRLLDGPGLFQDQLWEKKPDSERHLFGGKYGTQFKTLEELTSFNTAFDKVLFERGIDKSHKHSLLYFITFFKFDNEQQSIENNRHNHLHDYTIFMLNLISDSLAHIERMRKNPAYQEVYDEATNEIFFAKKELVTTMPLEELVEYLPDAKHADDVVRYLRITLYDDDLYVPEDLVITIHSNKERKLKSLSGAQVKEFILPKNLLYETFTFMIGNMLSQHKKYNTNFYQEMIKDHSTLTDFKSFNNKFKKHNISTVKSLARVGIPISDYLVEHKLCTTKRELAVFLFEYFALFKAMNLKKPIAFPEGYSQLIPFYIKNGINSETIRYMMKDAGEI